MEKAQVVPLVGTWIEIYVEDRYDICVIESFPSWERGLK